MKKLLLFGTLAMIVIAALRVGWIWHERQQAEKPAEAPTVHVSDDQLVVLKKFHQSSMKDARELNGKPLWVSAAGQMLAYPATAAHVDSSAKGLLLLGAESLHAVNFIEQKSPKGGNRIPAGERQVVMLFHRGDDAKQIYGVPVGYLDGGVYTFYLDEIFFYEDPHLLYKHWPAATWAAVDRHEAIKGMSEGQTQIALGQVSHSASTQYGNRLVEYYNDGHPIDVTYAHDAATEIVKK